MKTYFYSTAVIIGLLAAPLAHAKRDRREGFNFGTSVRLLDSNESDNGKGEDTSGTSRKQSDSQSISPYVGWVIFDNLNLGLQGLFESGENHETVRTNDGQHEIKRDSKSSLTGGDLMFRFLFARVMFFQLGAGFYERRMKVTTEYRNVEDSGSFQGESESSSHRTVGPGYHAGGGVEIPVTEGFYFTSSYIVRTIMLRQTGSGSGAIGGNKANLQKRELMFGLSHYVN